MPQTQVLEDVTQSSEGIPKREYTARDVDYEFDTPLKGIAKVCLHYTYQGWKNNGILNREDERLQVAVEHG